MIDNQEKIQLNHQIYHLKNIDELQQLHEPFDSWLNSIYQFLKNWFDESEYIITHTSGSTGKPKEIRLSKIAMRNSAKMTNVFFGLIASKTALLCLPASYIAGKMMLVRAIVGGYNLITVEPKANPFEDIDTVIDFTAITPYQLNHSVRTLKSKNVKQIIVGGGHVNSKLEAIVQDLPTKFYETYGMTETASHIALRCFNGIDKSEYFTTLEGVQIRQDKRGCLQIKAPHLNPNEFTTNDIVEIKGENSFRWLSRADSVINSAGVKIFPEQVEKKLEGLIPSSYFIYSQPDKILGEKVILMIESTVYTENQLLNLKLSFNKLLDKYEIPKGIYFQSNFIYSSSNKVLRKESFQQVIGE